MTASIDLFRQARERLSFRRGDTIFRQGEEGAVMYVVIEGEVDVLVDGYLVDTVGAGAIIGEMALLDSSPRSATATAATDCALVPVSARQFEFMIQQTPFFALEVMRTMAERLRSRPVA